MVWFWTRGVKELQVETRYDNVTSEFVVTVVSSDSSHTMERFKSLTAFQARLVALDRRLEAEHWKNSGPPLFIPEGFPNRRLRGDDDDDGNT